MPPQRFSWAWLIVCPVVAAVGCLAWLVYSNVGTSPALASEYAAAPIGTANAASEVAQAVPSPVPAFSSAPSSPAMAYSAPHGRHGTFVPPLGGYVAQLFGPTDFALEPPRTYNGTTYPHFHTGIDIDAQPGTPVGASAGGVVVQTGAADGQPTGYGNFVVIEHPNGYQTLYAHLDRVLVTVGERVQQLELIGVVGSTGLSTGPHLHFEIRRYGDFLDPLPYLLRNLRAW